MNDFMIDFKEIQGQDAANTILDVFIESVFDEKGLKLNIANDFFAQCLHNLENPSTNPKAKFYTLYMLKQLSQKETITRKLFGPFSKHELYAYLEQLTLTVDPMKIPQEKGKNLFPGDKATGNNFMRLLVQSMLNWGTRFGSTKDRPTRFTTTMEKLNKAKVVMPANMIYYAKRDKSETPTGPTGPEPKKQQKKKMTQDSMSSAPSAPKMKDPKEKYASEIKFMFNKVELLLSIIEDTDEAQQIQKEVNINHQKFVKDHQKLQAQQEQMLDGQAEDIIGLYFKLMDFYEEEKKLFNLHAKNNDYATYISGYAIAVEKIFEASKLRNDPPKKQQPSIEAKINKPSKPDIPKSNAPPSKSSLLNKSAEDSLSRQNLRKQASGDYERQNRFTEASRVVDNFFSKLQKCSKSPANVYGSIAKSMSKEKQNTIVTRKKNPMAISQFTKSRYGGSSVARSTVQLKGIFAAPPNPAIRARNYEGELVLQLGEADYVRQSILKQQGHRRFKVSHFKVKYVLYEDESIQIGFRLSQIYQKVQKFSSMMMFELFFGNKLEQVLNRFTLQFHGDKQSLIYTSPQVIDETIKPMSQIKLQLLNIPQKIPFAHITVQASYEVDRERRQVSAYLPNSILHMVSYFQISTHQYGTSWSDCVKILKSQTFKLSHYFPPDQLKTLIPSLKENTSYSEFNRPGSMIDYELFTEVIIQQSYQGLLKINVRPDLTVVLQVGVYQSQENCLKNFRFYLQALEMVLKSHLD